MCCGLKIYFSDLTSYYLAAFVYLFIDIKLPQYKTLQRNSWSSLWACFLPVFAGLIRSSTVLFDMQVRNRDTILSICSYTFQKSLFAKSPASFFLSLGFYLIWVFLIVLCIHLLCQTSMFANSKVSFQSASHWVGITLSPGPHTHTHTYIYASSSSNLSLFTSNSASNSWTV